MYEDQLYELASKRVDKHNRRWILWGVNILAFLIFMGAFIALKGAIPVGVGLAILVIWGGVLVLHGIIIGMTQNRDQEVEKEVARLRREIYDEKPKRLALDDDGELIDLVDEPQQRADKKRGDSV